MNERSILKFERYIVKSITYQINEDYVNEDDTIELPLDFKTEKKINNNKMEIELIAGIFQGAKKYNYPFEMEVAIKGYFSVKNFESDIKKFESNAIAIMFPYLRAIISTYTVNANVAPVLLPAMNINEYFRKKHERDGR